MDEPDWTLSFRAYHDEARKQANVVNDTVRACVRDEPQSLLISALNDIVTELVFYRGMCASIRLGIEGGHLTG